MPFLIVLAVLVGLVLLLLFVPAFARIQYDGELRVKITVLGIPLPILPAKEKPVRPLKSDKGGRKTDKDKKKKGGTLGEIVRAFREDGPGATLTYLGKLAGLSGDTVRRALRSVTVDVLHLEMRVGTDEASDTAIRYGQVCAALYPALTAVSNGVRIRRREIRVEPDFLAERSEARLDIRLHMRVYQLLGTSVSALLRYLTLKSSNAGR